MDNNVALTRWKNDPEEGSIVRHLNPSRTEKSFRCEHPDCALAFDAQQDLDKHLLKHKKPHKPSKQLLKHIEPLKCGFTGCGRSFKYPYYLKDHMKRHVQNVLPCIYCGKIIKHKKDLIRHVAKYCKKRPLQKQVGELEMVNVQDVDEPSEQDVGEPPEQDVGQAMYHVPVQPIVPAGDKSPELALLDSDGEDTEIDLDKDPKDPPLEKVKKVNFLVSSLQGSAERFGENHRFNDGQHNTAESESSYSLYRAWNDLQEPINCVDQVAGERGDRDSERDVSHLNNLEDFEMDGYPKPSVTAPHALQYLLHAPDFGHVAGESAGRVSDIPSTTDESVSEQDSLMGVTYDEVNSEFEDNFAMIQLGSDSSDAFGSLSNFPEQMDWEDGKPYN